MPASTSSSACTAWASRSTRRSSGRTKLDRPCRIYAPVGTHETLLAYLVRRLLENGANTSFVNQIADPDVTARHAAGRSGRAAPARCEPVGAPHPRIALPRDLFGAARDEFARARSRQRAGAGVAGRGPAGRRASRWRPCPLLADGPREGSARDGDQSRRPPRRRRHGRSRRRPSMVDAACALRQAVAGARRRRARRLPARAADLMEARLEPLLGPIVREAGKTFGNAVAEVREAVDFLRYYASCSRRDFSQRHAPAARRRSPASARGISRWRSSPARSPPRWPPATR